MILRKAYGGAYIVMDSRTLGSDVVLAWPGAEIAVMGAAGAVAILERRAIAAAEDPEATRLRLEEEYRVTYCTPRIAAERGYVDQVIDPADTRAFTWRPRSAGCATSAYRRPNVVMPMVRCDHFVSVPNRRFGTEFDCRRLRRRLACWSTIRRSRIGRHSGSGQGESARLAVASRTAPWFDSSDGVSAPQSPRQASLPTSASGGVRQGAM